MHPVMIIFEAKIFPMKKLAGIIILFFFSETYAQYYYKDLLAAADIMQQMKTYKANSIRKVTATGITPEGAVSPDFSETQEISPDGTMLKITTRINQTVSMLLHRFNEKGMLLSTVDSSAGIVSTTTYSYDVPGKIISISNSIADPDSLGNFSQSELHIYIYKNDKPEKMWRIINGADSLEIRFTTDDNGNIIEEKSVKKGVESDPLYYYYDDKNRLTDIVRYNYKVRRLLPDFLFEYDDHNRVIQKITTTSDLNLGYLTWRYLYNDKGLKTKEALFNKEKQLQGRIDYTYN